MPQPFWFNRLLEYWVVPADLDVADLVRRGRVQVVQAGTFGPMFYGLADDASVDRNWVGMPLVGVRENLEFIAGLIPRIQDAGARVVGQMSLAWHYGDHEKGLGLFGAWERIWTPELLGPAPIADPVRAQQRLADGSLRRWPIPGRPYYTYAGCICNPGWAALLKPMVKKAIGLGVDGFNVHHNFESFCRCGHCRQYLTPRLEEGFAKDELAALLGPQELVEAADLLSPRADCPAPLRLRFDLAVMRATQQRRKDLFDEVFIAYGRSLKPGLLLAQWYHKYDFRAHDERCLLTAAQWARDEDYIWYSQGGHKGMSAIDHGYLADMGLPSRFAYAAGRGRPFVINKYDSRRLRLSISEAGANHAAAPAFHYGGGMSREEYCGPIVRYHRFLADHDELVHPARPYSQLGLVYPRRAELEGETDSVEPLKRLGRLLEDEHYLFDLLLDEQLEEQADRYEALMLPEVERLSRREEQVLRRVVERGGTLVLTGATGTRQAEGLPHLEPLLADWRVAPDQGRVAGRAAWGRVLFLPSGPWQPQVRKVREGVEVPVYPPLSQDAFGRAFAEELREVLGPSWLRTDAPWSVRVRAWRPDTAPALVLHWVNYHQDEESAIEVPLPTQPFRVECRPPAGYRVARVEWRYPEMAAPTVLPHEQRGDRVCFTAPGVIVYGMSVLYLEPK